MELGLVGTACHSATQDTEPVKDHKFKVSLGFTESFWLAWATWGDPVSK